MKSAIRIVFLSASAVFVFSGPVFSAVQSPGGDLRAYCLERGCDYFWDPLAKNAIVRTFESEIRFHAGSEYFLRNGHLERMSQKAVLSGGALLAPAFGAAAVGLGTVS